MVNGMYSVASDVKGVFALCVILAVFALPACLVTKNILALMAFFVLFAVCAYLFIRINESAAEKASALMAALPRQEILQKVRAGVIDNHVRVHVMAKMAGRQ